MKNTKLSKSVVPVITLLVASMSLGVLTGCPSTEEQDEAIEEEGPDEADYDPSTGAD